MKTITLTEISRSNIPYPLAIESLEGGIYIALIPHDNQLSPPITTRDGRWVKTRSLNEMRSILGEYPWTSVTLIHSPTYDEMIGTPSSQEKLRLTLDWREQT